MSAEQNKAIVRRWIDEQLNQHNLAVLDELVAETIVAHSPMGEWAGREQYRQFWEAVLRSAPDIHCTIEELLAEGETVAFRFTATFTHTSEFMGVAPTGKQLIERGQTLVHLVDGKVVEFWDQPDVFGLLQQLGALPTAEQEPARP